MSIQISTMERFLVVIIHKIGSNFSLYRGTGAVERKYR